MKKTLPYLYLFGALVVPTTIALADGSGEHAHAEDVAVADPSSRIYVMVAVGVVFALMIGWVIWSKKKSKAPMD